MSDYSCEPNMPNPPEPIEEEAVALCDLPQHVKLNGSIWGKGGFSFDNGVLLVRYHKEEEAIK